MPVTMDLQWRVRQNAAADKSRKSIYVERVARVTCQNSALASDSHLSKTKVGNQSPYLISRDKSSKMYPTPNSLGLYTPIRSPSPKRSFSWPQVSAERPIATTSRHTLDIPHRPVYPFPSSSDPFDDSRRERSCPPILRRKRSIPLPSQTTSSEPISLHPCLAFRDPGILQWFDVSKPLRELVEPYPGCWQDLATFPQLPSLAVLIPGIPWALVVQGASGVVVVADVLRAIQATMQVPIDESQQKRLSLLKGKHRFMGLSTSNVGNETFVMHLC
ncbi:hypothetical protein C8J56DRAFT_1087109 [Mycena floridula]|nr:hypothetical protein C8J56DRAFT_1087109 [Mycena floridula]